MNISPFYDLVDPSLLEPEKELEQNGKTKMRHGCAMMLGQAKERIIAGCRSNTADEIDRGLSMICPIFRCALVNTGLPCAENCNSKLGELGNLLQDEGAINH